MKKLSVLILASLVFALFGPVTFSQAARENGARKIVVFDGQALNDAAKDELVARAGGVKIKNLNLIGGMAVYLPSKAAEKALLLESGVLRIDDDVEVTALRKTAPAQPAEVLPWGVDRIDADLAWGTTTGDPVKVAILDTGIDLTHPDLAANVKGGVNTIYPLKSPNDDNGHGTHVAGIIAAQDNEIGVIGVAPKADLYAVKVLSRTGSGYLSDIIEGLDWSIQNKMQVVNMSLGTSSNVPSFYDAIKRAYQAGIVLVAAAGNDYGGAVNYPAAYPEVIAVSATGDNDQIASFSSVGPQVDLAAPGASIYSTYKGSTYKTLSGTSMASPHVAGAAALVLNTAVGAYDLDGDYAWDPNEVKNKLEATAENLGLTVPNNLYGFGLVDAEKAVL
ncbi:MAG: S8 family peptidase [Thermodesulfobacteriota bacterium]